MSGGLDSTPIAVQAARALRAEGRRFHGYSMQDPRGGTDLPIIDEAPDVAAAAAGEPNIEVQPVSSPGFYALLRGGHDIDDFHTSAGDEPVNSLLRHAASLGAPVMFSGWGGDEIVTHAGRGAFAELFWAGRWGLLHRHLAARCRRLGGTVRGRLVWSVLLQSLPLGPRHWLLRRLGKDDQIGALQSSPLPFLPRRHQGRIARSPVVDGPDSRRNKRGYAESWWMEKRLESHAQQGARHGLAYVFPMLDLDLIAHAMRVPGIFYSLTPGDRSMIRAATEGILPDAVRLRIDKLMAYPLESLRLAEGRPMVLERLAELAASPLVTEFVNLDALRDRMDALPGPEEVRAETVAAAARGEQPVLDDGGYETALRLAMILAEHEGSLGFADEPGGDDC
jgi:asparagine synthase (glutamine-hydrolysing)